MTEDLEQAIGWLSALDAGSEYGATNKEIILSRLEQDERVINKAIEYIERNARKCGNGEEWFESSYCCTSLLNILKENRKEV